MKPRTKFDKQVIFLNNKVRDIKPNAIHWALKHLIPHPAFRNKNGIAVCGDCGHKFTCKDKGGGITCPHCGTKLEILDTLQRTLKRGSYFSVTQIIDGVQVYRTFLLNASFKKGEPIDHYTREVCRYWIDGKGQVSLTGRRRTLGFYLDSFNWSSKIELRQDSDVFQTISNTYVYPRYRLIRELKRNGMRRLDIDFHPVTLMKKTLSDCRIETLLKSGNIKVLTYFLNNPSMLNLCWNSYKIALRHKYEIKDIQLWCDMIKLLDKCGKDIHSTKYICPIDMVAEHDRWNKRIMRLEEIERNRRNLEWERERLEREKENIEKELTRESEYANSKGCYFGLVLRDNEIEVSVLDSIKAYLDEGTAMHHCVFTNAYYDKPDSIILSAHYPDGTRIETIEFSLTQNKVIQSRGAYNKNTELHDRIINLVNSNAHQFIEAKMKSEKSQETKVA